MSGEAVAYENHTEVQRVSLSPNQLETLSRWLDQHRHGWGGQIEPSLEPIAFSVRVTRADETTNDLAIVDRAGGGHYMRLSGGPGVRWQYQSSGGVLKTRYAQQSISENDPANLHELVFGPRTATHLTRKADTLTLVKAVRALMTATPPNYAEAIAKLKEVDALPTHSTLEQHWIYENLGYAYEKTKDYANAARFLEADDGQLGEADVPRRIRELAELYYQLKNYDKAIEFGTRAINGGYAGSELDTFVSLVGQSYYLKRDWQATLKFYDDLVNGEIRTYLKTSELPQEDANRLARCMKAMVPGGALISRSSRRRPITSRKQ